MRQLCRLKNSLRRATSAEAPFIRFRLKPKAHSRRSASSQNQSLCFGFGKEEQGCPPILPCKRGKMALQRCSDAAPTKRGEAPAISASSSNASPTKCLRGTSGSHLKRVASCDTLKSHRENPDGFFAAWRNKFPPPLSGRGKRRRFQPWPREKKSF